MRNRPAVVRIDRPDRPVEAIEPSQPRRLRQSRPDCRRRIGRADGTVEGTPTGRSRRPVLAAAAVATDAMPMSSADPSDLTRTPPAALIDLVGELPRIRSDLRRGVGADPTTLSRLVSLVEASRSTRLAQLTTAAPVSATPLRTAWIASQASQSLACERRVRRDLAVAGLLADLDDDAERSAALTALMPTLPTSVPRLIRQRDERIDGTGLPRGLRRSQLSPGSQLLALAVSCGQRLAVDDAIVAGLRLSGLATEADDGVWSAEYAAVVLSVALPLASGVVGEATRPRGIVRIDAAHHAAEAAETVEVSSALSVDETTEPRTRRLTGLRASRSRPTGLGVRSGR